MRRSLLAALLALTVVGIGAAASVLVLLSSPTPAQAAAEALKKSSAKVGSEIAAEISPQKPLVIVFGIFRKGGYKTADDTTPTKLGDYITVYPERALSKMVLTPDANGWLANVTEDISAVDGTPPIRISLLDGSRIVGPAGNVAGDGASGTQPSDPFPDADGPPGPTGHTGAEDRTKLRGWLNAQLDLPRIAREEWGYTYAGKSTLNGQPSIRYEQRLSISSLPNGQVFEPPRQSLNVLEFVEANPLLGHESRYTITGDGELVLDFQKTVVSISAGEPPAASLGAGTR